MKSKNSQTNMFALDLHDFSFPVDTGMYLNPFKHSWNDCDKSIWDLKSVEPTDICIIFLLAQTNMTWISEEIAVEKDLAKFTSIWV